MMREPAPVTPPVVLTIAGSDSGGGAGIQADLKTIEAGGAFGTSAITSVTAQNTQGVASTHALPVAEIEAQCDAVFSDFDVAALKTGMLGTRAIVELVTEQVRQAAVPAVVDPVMVAATGDRLLDTEAEAAYEELIGESTLVTPNVDETEVLLGRTVETVEDARAAGEDLLDLGVEGALVKGGHLPGEAVVDVLVTEQSVETFHHPRVDTDATHGSGCTLSSAIATRLAHGDDLPDAVETGIDLLGRAVRYALDVGGGPGSVHHTVGLRDRAEREGISERVRSVVRAFLDRDVSPLVPEVGMNVVGATPYAEVPAECAAVDGRISRTLNGVEATGSVRFGASDNVARVLIAARERDPDLQFAVNCRFDETVRDALEAVDWPTAEYDPEASADRDGADRIRSMRRGIEDAILAAEEPPVAVCNHADVGIEPTLLLLAPDESTIVERTGALLEAVEG